jgi:CheY-like chemotaxis protein
MVKATGIKHCILVVDDDDDVLFLMKQTLQSHGYNTTISPNGENIMDILTHSPPDMILLDIQMKGIDGGTVCQLIKTNTSTAGIPILMFSSNEDIAIITKQCGADGYIKKPFDPGKFNEVIEHVLNPTKIN